MRKKRLFKIGRFYTLEKHMHRLCQQRGHSMMHVPNWRWREEGVNEKYVCKYCKMEALIQFRPPTGYDHVHGVATHVHCTYDPDKDRLVNGSGDGD